MQTCLKSHSSSCIIIELHINSVFLANVWMKSEKFKGNKLKEYFILNLTDGIKKAHSNCQEYTKPILYFQCMTETNR